MELCYKTLHEESLEGFLSQFDLDMRPCRRHWVARRSAATEPRSGRKRPRNQTRVQTSTGIWQVQYNGENRPISWSCGATNIVMSFDRMGRRVEYLETVSAEESVVNDGITNIVVTVTTNAYHRFVYDGYLCIQRLNALSNNAVDRVFGWDPSEPVATRPLWMQRPAGSYNFFYFHDGNKNVSELVSYQAARGEPAHYEYAPFGALTAATTNTAFTAFNVAATNPFRFSSEYADDALGLVYYNYRHYEPVMGRWLSRDPLEDVSGRNEYSFLRNEALLAFDLLGESCTGYVDYSAFSSGCSLGNELRKSCKSPSLFLQFGSNACGFHQEEYFEKRYCAVLEKAKYDFRAYILSTVDCKSESVNIGIGGILSYNAGDTSSPFFLCSGGSLYDGLKPQSWYERYCSLGNFSVVVEQPISIEYTSQCENCLRRYKWRTTMYIADDLGVSPSDHWPVSWLRPFAQPRRVRLAEWEFTGEGECTCDCDNK